MRQSYLLCAACDLPTTWPIWIRYELLDYRPHCWRCAAERITGLTTAAAIQEALDIINTPRIIRPRVKVAGGR
jgi:hypothetical protein